MHTTLAQQIAALEVGARADAMAQTSNTAAGSAQATINGHSVSCTMLPVYCSGRQGMSYRAHWKVDYKRTAAASVLPQVSR